MISIAPVRKQVLVKASQVRAFDLFTKGMSRWWPPTHSILKSPLKEYVVEPMQADGGIRLVRMARARKPVTSSHGNRHSGWCLRGSSARIDNLIRRSSPKWKFN